MPRKSKPAALTITPHEGCDKCSWWVAKAAGERPPETFVYCFVYEYDVDKAREMTKGREVHDVPTSQLAVFVDYPREEGKINILRTYIDDKHIDHVDMNEPVILAFNPPDRDDPTAKRAYMPIDGSHRIARAIKEGAATIKCVVLSEEETDKILKDHSPRRPKKAKPRKK
jgi:hypothetical protein